MFYTFPYLELVVQQAFEFVFIYEFLSALTSSGDEGIGCNMSIDVPIFVALIIIGGSHILKKSKEQKRSAGRISFYYLRKCWLDPFEVSLQT